MRNPVLKALLTLSLLGFVGCAPSSGQDSGEATGPASENGGRVELSEARTSPEPSSYRRPPVWLVTGGEAVQASYGLYCESDVCYAEQEPEEDLSTAEVVEKEKTFLVFGGEEDGEVSAGVVGYEDAPGDTAGPGAFIESGIPYYMREIEVRPVLEGEGPNVERASYDEGVSVFELESTGNAGDRLLSIFVDKGDAQPASYHLRLDPGEEGENPPPEEKEFPGTVARVTTTPDTTTSPLEEATQALPVRGVEKTPLDGSPRRIETGEGYLWVLGSRKTPGPEPRQDPGAGGAAGSAEDGSGARAKAAGPPPDAVLLKMDPGTREVLSTIDVGAPAINVEVGAGSVWLICVEGEKVLRLDPETGEVTHEIPVGGLPSEIAVTDDAVWVGLYSDTQSGRVVRIDPAKNEVAAEIETPGIAGSVAVDAETGDVWAVSLDQTQGYIDEKNNQLVRIDPEKNEISERLEVDGGASSVAAGGGKVWATNMRGELSKIDPEEREVESATRLDRGRYPNPGSGMKISAGALWVSGPDGVTRLDAASGGASGSVELGEYESEDLAVDGETGVVWVVGAGTPTTSGTLTRITP